MFDKEVTKLWQNKYVSVRDYEIEKAKKLGGIRITHKGKTIELSAEELNNYKAGNKLFPSKFGKPYKLVDIPFTVKEST